MSVHLSHTETIISLLVTLTSITMNHLLIYLFNILFSLWALYHLWYYNFNKASDQVCCVFAHRKCTKNIYQIVNEHVCQMVVLAPWEMHEVRVALRSVVETGRHFPFLPGTQLDLLVLDVVLRMCSACGIWVRGRSAPSNHRPCNSCHAILYSRFLGLLTRHERRHWGLKEWWNHQVEG